MAKGKVISSKTMSPVTGGSNKMVGKSSVGTKTPGVTGKSDSGGGGKWAKGGSGKMFGKSGAAKARAC